MTKSLASGTEITTHPLSNAYAAACIINKLLPAFFLPVIALAAHLCSLLTFPIPFPSPSPVSTHLMSLPISIVSSLTSDTGLFHISQFLLGQKRPRAFIFSTLFKLKSYIVPTASGCSSV